MAITYLYLMKCLTYGAKHPIKVGIARDVEKRCAQWRRQTQGALCTVVLGYFRFTRRQDAQAIETLVRHRFPIDRHYGRYSREVLDAGMTEIMAFIRKHVDRQMFCVCEFVQ